MNKEVKEKRPVVKKSDNSILVVVICFMIVLLCLSVAGIYLMYTETKNLRNEIEELKESDVVEDNKTNTNSNNNKNNQNNNNNNNQKPTPQPQTCTSLNGKYYGEYFEQQGQFTIDEKSTYTFNSNGTFTYDVVNAGGTSGTYTISNNVITLVSTRDVGPGTTTYTLNVTSDCKKISDPTSSRTWNKTN